MYRVDACAKLLLLRDPSNRFLKVLNEAMEPGFSFLTEEVKRSSDLVSRGAEKVWYKHGRSKFTNIVALAMTQGDIRTHVKRFREEGPMVVKTLIFCAEQMYDDVTAMMNHWNNLVDQAEEEMEESKKSKESGKETAPSKENGKQATKDPQQQTAEDKQKVRVCVVLAFGSNYLGFINHFSNIQYNARLLEIILIIKAE